MATRIDQFASSYLQNVQPGGDGKLRASCPLCGHKRTFILHKGTGLWFCYSCQGRGGLPTLLAKLGFSRKSIDRIVSGLNLTPALSKKFRRRINLSKKPSELPEYILGAYESCPVQLLDAGFDMDLLQENDVGFDEGNDRITFAVRDFKGTLAAVSGRACEDHRIPRYKIYDAEPPDLPFRAAGEFYGLLEGYKANQKDHLYGFHQVYPERFFQPDIEHPPLIIVEGFKGRLWLVQNGFSHTVALMGDFLTASQLMLLAKIRGPKFIMLDHEPGKNFLNEKGHCQAYKMARQLRKTGPTFICEYEEGTDPGTAPDDLTRDEIAEMVRAASPLTKIKHNNRTNTRRVIHHE
jgi:hypothetical protein